MRSSTSGTIMTTMMMKCSWIEAGLLAAGSVPYHVDDLRSLHDQGLRAILSLTEHPITRFQTITPALFDQLGFTYVHTPVRDHYAPDAEQTRRIVEFFHMMQATSLPTYVHCNAGIGRTGTILHLFYLLRRMALADAERHIRQRRPQCVLLSEVQRAFLTSTFMEDFQ